MKNKQLWAACWLLAGIVIVLPKLYSQTPSDALLMKKGELCLAVIYSHESWDEYWEGTLKRNNGNLGTFTRQSVMPMFALGISDRINIIAGLPWVHTQASAGQMRGATGFQDAGLWVKAKAWEKAIGAGSLSVHATAGITVPASDYLADYMPFSLGLGCVDASLRAIVQYQIKGWYFRAHSGFHARGNTIIERDYYYTTQGFYTDEIDMPNALDVGAVIGYWNKNHTLKTEITADGFHTLGGFDIRRQDGGFPSNKMIFTRLGAGLQYYPLKGKGLGLVASGGYIISGRNVGQSLLFSGGLTYQFPVWK